MNRFARLLGLVARFAVLGLALTVLGAVLLNVPGLASAPAYSPSISSAAPSPVVARRGPPRPVTSAELICPGPETIGVRGAREVGVAPVPVQVSAASPPLAARGRVGVRAPAVAGAGAPDVGTLAAQTVGGSTLATGGPGSGAGAGAGAATVVGSTAEPRAVALRATGGSAPGLVGTQTSLLPRGVLRGLVSAPCTGPTDDAWLVGGGGEPGRRGRLVIANPHATTARVSIDVLAAGGPVRRTSGSAVAVAPRSRVVLLLDALAPGVLSPVLHVRSSGGSVVTVLHDSRLTGIVPGGTDDVSPGAPPARRVLVPGVAPAGPDSGAVLRIGVPGAAGAVVQVRMIGERGPVELPGGGVLRVPGSATKDVDLGALPAGGYAVQVNGDVPVLAAVMTQRRRGPIGPADLAWSASTPPLAGPAGIGAVAPPSAVGTLLLSAPGGAAGAVEVLSVAPDGVTDRSTVRVAAGSTRVLSLAAGRATWLVPQRGSGPVVGARVLQQPDPAGALITVTPLRATALTRVDPDLVPAD
jgi:Family of unknown function (DUF5719)